MGMLAETKIADMAIDMEVSTEVIREVLGDMQ